MTSINTGWAEPSGSFTVGLLRALHFHKKEYVPQQDLAEEACKIEIDLLKEPTGKQDQYIAAYGGLRYFQFGPGPEVAFQPGADRVAQPAAAVADAAPPQLANKSATAKAN